MPRIELGVPTIGIAVTPSDTVNLDTPCRALYVGDTGGGSEISVEMGDASGSTGTVILENVLAGAIYNIGFIRINNTGTTAASLIAFV
jgi:hypothetical protein